MTKQKRLNTRAIRQFPLDPVIPDLTQWPIYALSEQNKAFLEAVNRESKADLLKNHGSSGALKELLGKTLYLEKARLNRKPWRVDAPDEKPFWKEVNRRLLEHKGEIDSPEDELLLESIIQRYSQEILGSFRIPTYRFAKQVLPMGFNRLLNESSNKNFKRLFGNQYGIHSKIHILGEIEQLRNLSTKGTLILVPTHHSNLDSILIGWAIDAIGLPAFIYGAGLNLFSARLLAYFMNRLGAYKIDRRKKNPIYLETLKSYSTQAIERGAHSLFFPGGTRSRSGALESKLKLGLMGTAIEAQRRMIEQAGEGNEYRKVFIAPLTISYNFVLEAPLLIKEHLKRVGKERFFVEQDKFSSSTKIARFILKFFSASSDIYLSYGKCMDIMGNPVDIDGNSMDERGNQISLDSYFNFLGKHKIDNQRDSEYTRKLSDHIVKAFYRNNVVLCSHLVAFAAFRLLQQRSKIDLYELLRLPEEDRVWSRAEMLAGIEKVAKGVLEMRNNGQLKNEPGIEQGAEHILDEGVRNLGIYHNRATLKFSKEKDTVICEDLPQLYFYHNRLEGYELDKYLTE